MIKSLFFAIALPQLLLATEVDCTAKLQNIQEQINKTKLAKHINTNKLDYLNNKHELISQSCVDGKIELSKLKSIEFDTKISYEKQKLKHEEMQLKSAYKKLEKQRAKLDAKAEALKQRRLMLEDY